MEINFFSLHWRPLVHEQNSIFKCKHKLIFWHVRLNVYVSQTIYQMSKIKTNSPDDLKKHLSSSINLCTIWDQYWHNINIYMNTAEWVLTHRL